MTPTIIDFDNFARRLAGERTVPHNLNAEEAILGSILLHNDVLPLAAATLSADDFFREAHSRLFLAMLKLQAKGEPIELVTLRAALEASGHLQMVGGPAYIASLLDGLPRSMNVEAYARIVKDLAVRRSLIQAAAKATAAAYEQDLDIASITAAAQRDFGLVADRSLPAAPRGLDPAFLSDAVDVIAEGKKIADEGIRYLVDGIIPGYGMFGMLVAYAKVGKTTLAQALAAAVAMGQPFLDRPTTQTRVLVIAAEDPPEWTAFLARTLTVDPSCLTFYRAPVILNAAGLQAIAQTVKEGGYGLVLIASWQAVVRGLLENENDNVGGVRIVSEVKIVAQETGIPWLIDAHAGKGENQDDEADPMMALRGASGAAGAADYILSLRYGNGAFGTQRRLSGKGRFVTLAPMTIDYEPHTGLYTCLGTTKDATKESTWRQIAITGALDHTPRSLTDIARRCGLIDETDKLGGQQRKRLVEALKGREEVGRMDEIPHGGGHKTTLYRLLEVH